MFSGDPVNGSGYLDSNSGDRYIYMSAGPFTLAAGDSQDVIGVKIVAAGGNNIMSVAALRLFASHAKQLYWNNFKLETEEDKPDVLPTNFTISRAYPNPFQNSTILHYQIPFETHVSLKVYNMLGQRVYTIMDGKMLPNTYSAHWDGYDAQGHRVSNGIYFIRFEAAGLTGTRKVLVMR